MIRTNPDLALVVYSGDEVRGYLLPVLFPPTGDYVYDGLLYGNQSEGEEFSFKLVSSGPEVGIENRGRFVADGRIGNAMNPLILKIGVDQVEMVLDVTVFPNPSTGSLNVMVNTISTSPIDIKIKDMQGRVVLVKTFDQVMAGKHSLKMENGSMSEGSYSLIISQDNKISTKQIIVK